MIGVQRWALTGALAVLPGANVAAGDDGGGASCRPAELQAEVGALRQQVRRLRQEKCAGSLTQMRAEEIRALVADVLADADSRASMLQDGAVAGYDKGFFLTSADGSFRLRMNGRLQGRFVFNHQEKSAEDDDRWGFENRRFRLSFSGHLVDPTWKYKIGGSFDRDGGGFETSDVYVAKDFGEGWSVRAGQFKPPFMREWLLSAFRQLAADRSLVNAAFNQDRSDGVELEYEGDALTFRFMCSDGFDRDDTAALDEDTEIALTARAEWLPDGSWKQFRDFTSWPDDEFGLLLGAAGHWEKDEYGSLSGPEEEILGWTVDASAEFGGAHAFAAITGRSLDVSGQDQWGVVLQGGCFLVPDEWDCFARFEFGDDDSPADDLRILTIGVNRYFSGHDLKWTADLGYAFHPVADLWASSGAGWREDESDDGGQIVLRLQMQLLF